MYWGKCVQKYKKIRFSITRLVYDRILYEINIYLFILFIQLTDKAVDEEFSWLLTTSVSYFKFKKVNYSFTLVSAL